jgi:hypothetical protein
MQDDRNQKASDWTSWLSDCLLGIAFEYRPRDQEQTHAYVASAFVIEMQDEWFLITAGHVKEMFDCSKRGDVEILSTRLLDGFGSGPITKEGFDFDMDTVMSAFYYEESSGLDVGFIHLRPMYRRLLEANRIRTFSELNWESSKGQEFEFYLLLGLLYESVRANGKNWQVASMIASIKETDEPADCLVKKVDRFYGSIPSSPVYQSIKGMSGGPLLGFRRDRDGSLRYWIVGLQSGWDAPSHTIAVTWIAAIKTAFYRWLRDSGY